MGWFTQKNGSESAAGLVPPQPSLAEMQEMLDRGCDLLDRGDNDGAIEALEAPARAGVVAAWFNLGVAFMKRGDIDQAIHWYGKVAGEGNVDAMAYLGYVSKLKGDKTRAKEWLTMAAGRGNTSAATLLQMLDLDPNAPAAMIAAATGKVMGDAHASMGQFDLAVQSWTTAANAGDADAMFKIGQVKLRQGVRGEAILWWERAVRHGSRVAEAFLVSTRR